MIGFENRWALATLEAFAPPAGPGFSPGTVEVDYVGTLEEMRSSGTTLSAIAIRLALWIVAVSPMWLSGQARTIASLPASERAELLARLLAHRVYLVRELSLLLKLCACMALFRVPELRAQTRYDDPIAETSKRLPIAPARAEEVA